MAERAPPVLLLSTTNPFEARVIQAHLQAEGLAPELRGAVDGPYPFTVGPMGAVSVYVPADQLDDARLVMLAVEVDSSVGADRRPAARWTRGDAVVVVVLLAIVLLMVVARVAGGA